MKIGMVSDSLGHLSFFAMLNAAAKLGIQGVRKSVELLQAVAPSETGNDKPQEF
jgi:sugar phosphate isomerase/epimerase